MTNYTKYEQIATSLLKDENLLYSKGNGSILKNRVTILANFIHQYGTDGLAIEVNNNWSNPPAPKTAKHYRRIGGTTYQYQVWAVIR